VPARHPRRLTAAPRHVARGGIACYTGACGGFGVRLR
jgi:hypothetical protein